MYLFYLEYNRVAPPVHVLSLCLLTDQCRFNQLEHFRSENCNLLRQAFVHSEVQLTVSIRL